MLPITALAEDEVTEYPIVVGGTRVTSKNMDDVLGDGTVTFESTGEGKGTLTLTNANITGMFEESLDSFNIFGEGIDLTIELVGENKVGDGSANFALYSFEGDLTIGGSGTLDAESNKTSIIVIGEGLFIKVPADGTIGELEAEDGSHYYILEAGKAAPKAVITVKEGTVPKTGDPGNTGLWILLLGGSLLALVLSVVAGRKQGKKQR